MSVNKLAEQAATLELRRAVLKKIHEEGYVCKGGLASQFRVHAETMSRIVDWLVEEHLVRLVGSPIGCPYGAFGGKKGGGKTHFYTATKVDIEKRHPEMGDVLKFYLNPECVNIKGKLMPRRFFLARRKELVGRAREVKTKQEWVPVHFAGTHLASAFIASNLYKMAGVETVTLTSERVLRDAAIKIVPMSNGLFYVARKGLPSFTCRIEFESYNIETGRYKKYFDQLKACGLPTIYIALAPHLIAVLDRVARNRDGVAVVMYGDEAGCQSAIQGLMDGIPWQPPQRDTNGAKEGFVRGTPQATSAVKPAPSTTLKCVDNQGLKTALHPGFIALIAAQLPHNTWPTGPCLLTANNY